MSSKQKRSFLWAGLPVGAALAFVMVWLIMTPARNVLATPPNSPIIDGVITADGTDWDADELVVNDPTNDSAWGPGNELDNLYVTWDADYLYVGISYTVDANGMIVYIDTGLPGGETDFNSARGWTGAYPRNITVTASLDIDLMLARWFHNAPQAYLVDNNTSTDISGSVNVGATNNMVEYAIPWNVVGRPYSDTLCLVTVLVGGDNWGAADSMPDNASTNGDGGPDGLTEFYCFDYAPNQNDLVINELDADQTGTDAAEFVEIYDGGSGNTVLDGLVLVFYNGSNDLSYAAYDLDGYTTSDRGYFIAGNTGVPGVDLVFAGNFLQNGQDAVALFWGNGTDFPNGTPVQTANLVDALVYDTDDPDDPGLLVLLNPGQPQVNENSRGSGITDSNQRCPNGSGGQRNTNTYIQYAPTPDAANTGCIPDLTVTKTGDSLASPGDTVTYLIGYGNIGNNYANAVILSDTLPAGVTYAGDNSGLVCPACTVGATGELTWSIGTVAPATNFSFVLTAVITSGATFGEIYTNTVDIFTPDVESSISNNRDTWTTSISPLDLVLHKTGPTTTYENDILYHITVETLGVSTATQVIVTDTIPVSVTYTAQSSNALTVTVAGGEVIWEFGDMPAGSTETILLTVTVDAGAPSGALITNFAAASTSTPGDDPANNADQWQTTLYRVVPIADARAGSDGQTFIIQGRVTYIPGMFNPSEWGLQDASGGIAVYYSPAPAVALGDEVLLFATRSSFNNQEQMGAPVVTFLNLGPGPEVDPILYTTGAIASGETEGWLVEIEGIASGLSCPGDGTFYVDDGTGSAEVYIDADTGIDVCAMGADNGSMLRVVGFSTQYQTLFEVKPRRPADVSLTITEPDITKSAPTLVFPSTLYTYTITVGNRLGFDLTGVVVTDVIPTEVDFAYVLDGGAFDGSVVSWDIASLPNLGNLTLRFAVTSPVTNLLTVINDDYAIAATNFITATFGDPVLTFINVGPLAIHDIQGAQHLSLWNGQAVEGVHGIVTVARPSGFYMQDPNPDDNEATSEGIYVYTGSDPGVAVGDEVLVDAVVSEYRMSGTETNLTITELTLASITIQSSGNPLPAPTVIGEGGRIPPDQIIEDDATGDVEISGVFDPQTDGIDFYESLEGMLVQVNNAIAVGPTNAYGEIPVVGDNGAYSSLMTPRGGIVIQGDDFNPERIIIDDVIIPAEPVVSVGASFLAPVVGVMDYSFGNFKLLNTQPLSVSSSELISETTSLSRTDDQITVATFNLENLDPNDNPAKITALAEEIVFNLDAPDIIAVEEIQDNNGAISDTVVAADLTFQTLIDAITTAGGPQYDYRQIDPVRMQDGGEPGGNIRVGFLFRSDRGLTFVDRPGGDATTPVTATLGVTGIELNFSPGRIDPNDAAFTDSRKSLAGEFVFNGRKLIVIANHLNSKSGDEPLFGRYQPPELVSEIQRIQQAQVINGFVQHMLALDPQANVIVLGDFNDFQFSLPILTLAGSELTPLANLLPPEERYTYLYDGNSQALDHLLVSANLLEAGDNYDIVHMNAERPAANRPTDHDPALGRFTLEPPALSLSKSVGPAVDVPLGGIITYTIVLSNPTEAYAMGVILTDTLPDGVAFGGWVVDNGAVVHGSLITWTDNLPAGYSLTLAFTATVDNNPALYQQTITNLAAYRSQDAGTGLAAASFVVEAEPQPVLSILKWVTTLQEEASPGEVITYTIIVRNSGGSDATGVHITDTLPAEVLGNDVDVVVDIAAGDAFTLVVTATVSTDAAFGSTVTNTAYFTHASGNGSAPVSFTVRMQNLIILYLPQVFRIFTP